LKMKFKSHAIFSKFMTQRAWNFPRGLPVLYLTRLFAPKSVRWNSDPISS
jgi:hypothetical protein